MTEFKPNALTFQQGIERINQALKQVGLEFGKEIITSRDEKVMKAQDILETKNVPKGFKKWQLPIFLNSPSQMFISVSPPDIKVSEHSHDEGAGVRYISSGYIVYKGRHLGSGDWMHIPAGEKCDFKVG